VATGRSRLEMMGRDASEGLLLDPAAVMIGGAPGLWRAGRRGVAAFRANARTLRPSHATIHRVMRAPKGALMTPKL
jgi:hypothetical protein